MTKKEYLSHSLVSLGMKVYHDKIYNGVEEMEVVGLRKNSIELQGDYSGGTHNVVQSDWHPIDGAFRLRKRFVNSTRSLEHALYIIYIVHILIVNLMFNILDQLIAGSLEMSVAEYTYKIEKFSERRIEILLSAVLEGKDERVKQVKRILSNIK